VLAMFGERVIDHIRWDEPRQQPHAEIVREADRSTELQCLASHIRTPTENVNG